MSKCFPLIKHFIFDVLQSCQPVFRVSSELIANFSQRSGRCSLLKPQAGFLKTFTGFTSIAGKKGILFSFTNSAASTEVCLDTATEISRLSAKLWTVVINGRNFGAIK